MEWKEGDLVEFSGNRQALYRIELINDRWVLCVSEAGYTYVAERRRFEEEAKAVNPEPEQRWADIRDGYPKSVAVVLYRGFEKVVWRWDGQCVPYMWDEATFRQCFVPKGAA